MLKISLQLLQTKIQSTATAQEEYQELHLCMSCCLICIVSCMKPRPQERIVHPKLRSQSPWLPSAVAIGRLRWPVSVSHRFIRDSVSGRRTSSSSRRLRWEAAIFNVLELTGVVRWSWKFGYGGEKEGELRRGYSCLRARLSPSMPWSFILHGMEVVRAFSSNFTSASIKCPSHVDKPHDRSHFFYMC